MLNEGVHAFGIPDHSLRRPANVARVGFEHVFVHATIENWLVLKKWQSGQIRCWISVAVHLCYSVFVIFIC